MPAKKLTTNRNVQETSFKAGILSWLLPSYHFLPPFIGEIQVNSEGLKLKGLFREYAYSWDQILLVKQLEWDPEGGRKHIIYIRTTDRVFHYWSHYFADGWVEKIDQYKHVLNSRYKVSFILWLSLFFVLPPLDTNFQAWLLPRVRGDVFWLILAAIFWFLFCYLDELHTRKINNI